MKILFQNGFGTKDYERFLFVPHIFPSTSYKYKNEVFFNYTIQNLVLQKKITFNDKGMVTSRSF